MSDRILIDELRFRAIVGVHPWERERPQELRVSLEIELSTVAAGLSDELEDTVDYDRLCAQLIHRARRARRRTLEALAQDLADQCLEEERIEAVLVKLEKPEALRRARSVAVLIRRDRGPRASAP